LYRITATLVSGVYQFYFQLMIISLFLDLR